MKKDYVFLRGYINGNLGDDLFITILAERYSDYDFYLLSQKKSSGGELPKNVYYKLTFLDRVIRKAHSFFFGHKALDAPIQLLLKRRISKISDNSICNVNIIGSGFMESHKSAANKVFDDIFYSNKTYVLGANFGPYKSKEYIERFGAYFEKCADVCFREQYSSSLFPYLNIRNEADIVFLYDTNNTETDIVPNEKYVLISVVSPDGRFGVNDVCKGYYGFITSCIAYWQKRGVKVVLVGFCVNEGDRNTIDEILRCSNLQDIECFNYPNVPIRKMMGLFQNAECIIASRFHAIIIGLLCGKTVFPIIYSEKSKNVINDLFEGAHIVWMNQLEKIDVEWFLKNCGIKMSEIKLKNCIESANRQFEKLDEILAPPRTEIRRI